MAEMTQANTGAPAGGNDDLPGAGLTDNPLFRQLAVMVGIAASVALGVAVVLWSQTPNFSPLYGNLGQKDAAEVVAALEQAGVEFRIDESTGMVLVPAGKLQDVRMQLASQGLPNTTGMGMEMLNQDTGFGTSRMVEQARYHRALETELARTISTLTNVETARVHLALPKQSVFVRKRKQPSASVVLKLFNGRSLEQGQVDAIVHLVAASIPELESGKVTVVDHKGRLLSQPMADRDMKMSATQFEYIQKVEGHYRDRIVELLAPILGADRVQAQVTADIDFTVTEQTQERYNPDQPALRSEQVNEQASRAAGNLGVPGALSNQPPAAAVAPEEAGPGAEGEGTPLNSSRQATRNFELDRVVSHTRLSPNSIRRLSVAVVVDDVVSADAEGNPVRRERTPEEIERITALVREAVGFDARRGDSVQVINSAFQVPEPPQALPEPPIWEQAWVWDLAKQVGGALVVLILIFGVLRPTLKRLTATPVSELPEGAVAVGPDGQPIAVPAGAEGGGTLALGADGHMAAQLSGPASYEDTMEAARKLVDNDPKRVAQLVKTWVAEDAG